MTVSGNARAVLGAERVALNYIGHLSGIATATAEFVRLVAHTNARVCCTRKTTPGLRALQKYAVRCGGGFNHRFGLDDAILIKDNHVAVAGGVTAVLMRARPSPVISSRSKSRSIHLSAAEVLERRGRRRAAGQHGPCTMKKAVDMAAGRLVLEASGGITHETAAAVAATGVDYLSSGAITHSSTNLDVDWISICELVNPRPLPPYRSRCPRGRFRAVAPVARAIEV